MKTLKLYDKGSFVLVSLAVIYFAKLFFWLRNHL